MSLLNVTLGPTAGTVLSEVMAYLLPVALSWAGGMVITVSGVPSLLRPAT